MAEAVMIWVVGELFVGFTTTSTITAAIATTATMIWVVVDNNINNNNCNNSNNNSSNCNSSNNNSNKNSNSNNSNNNSNSNNCSNNSNTNYYDIATVFTRCDGCDVVTTLLHCLISQNHLPLESIMTALRTPYIDDADKDDGMMVVMVVV